MTLRITAALVALMLLSGGCAARHGRPILGGSAVPERSGTVAGIVTSSNGMPIEGRRVSAINIVTEMHYDAVTSSNGGYTIMVPEGRYRLEVELRGGEQVAKQPELTHVSLGDLDEMLDFVVR